MGRPKGARNKSTIIKMAEKELVDEKYDGQTLDCLFVIEKAMKHFYIRAETGKAVGRSPEQVDEDYRQAAAMANLAVPYRHSRLSAVKLAGDPNNPARFKDDATADELRAELMKRLKILVSAGLIDLKALPVPDGGIANQSIPGVAQSRINEE
jgi:hypothetical protein